MTRAADTYGSFADLADGAGQGWNAIRESNTAHDIAGLRQDIAALDDAQLAPFGPYVRSLYGPADAPIGRRTDMYEWAQTADDAEIADVLARDAAARSEQQEAARPDFEHGKDYYMRWLQWGMDQGFITRTTFASGRNHFIDRLRGTGLAVGTAGETTWRGQAAYYDAAGNNVVIGQSMHTDPNARIEAVRAGVRENSWREMSRVFGRTLPDWSRDAFAEHVNNSVASAAAGRPAEELVFDPEQRESGTAMYADQRALLHTAVYEAAGNQEGAALATAFMRAATSKDLSSPEYADFNAQMDRAWGVRDAFRAIANAVNHQQSYFADKYPGHDASSYQQWACQAVTEVLRSNDLTTIFGAGYQKPRPHIGAAALGARR